MSNARFISVINDQIKPLVAPYTGFRIYGLAQSMIRASGDKLQLIPSMVDPEGEGRYIGLDDKAPVTIYHKAASIAVTDKQNSGYGDARSDKVNTYQNTMIIFIDRKVVKMLPDEFVNFLQANIADQVKLKPYKSINIQFKNIILNSQQVFASEYQNFEYIVPPRFSLLAINYQIESVFDRTCFATCP